jgi:hypothetical protein
MKRSAAGLLFPHAGEGGDEGGSGARHLTDTLTPTLAREREREREREFKLRSIANRFHP